MSCAQWDKMWKFLQVQNKWNKWLADCSYWGGRHRLTVKRIINFCTWLDEYEFSIFKHWHSNWHHDKLWESWASVQNTHVSLLFPAAAYTRSAYWFPYRNLISYSTYFKSFGSRKISSRFCWTFYRLCRLNSSNCGWADCADCSLTSKLYRQTVSLLI